MSSAALITGLVSVGGTLVAANQTKKALQGAQNTLNNLQYQPIDINKLKADAASTAAQNAAASLQLERSLTPALADIRTTLPEQVNKELAQGGKLSADVRNQVASAGRTIGGSSGTLGGASVPLTAALIGQSAQDLINQRQAKAANLLAANPLPVAGLDPGSVASLEAANNAAANQFNVAKAGGNIQLLNSQGQANATEAGGLTSALSSLLGNKNFTSWLGNLFSSTPTNTGNPNPTPTGSTASLLNNLFGQFGNPNVSIPNASVRPGGI